MVWHHVAQRAGRVVELAARADIDELRRCDLHVVDIVVVPQRLDHHIRKARRHDVLDGFLAEEMVDAVDLAFMRVVQQPCVQCLRRREIVAEGLFDRDAAEGAGRLVHQPVFGKLFRNVAEKLRRHGKIEGGIGARRMGEIVRDFLVDAVLGEIAGDIADALAQALPGGLPFRIVHVAGRLQE